MLYIESEVLSAMTTNTDQVIADICLQQPVLLVFLRHFGCQFCREALDELSQLRPTFAEKGTELVFVHMAENKVAEAYFKKFNLQDVQHISDPNCRFYEAFGLMKGNLSQIFGLQSWIRGFKAQVKYGAEIGQQLGDNFQMPGVFTLFDGEVKESYIHRNASDRPNYLKMANCCTV